MPDVEIIPLPIDGYRGERLANRFFRQRGGASSLAVLYPGLNYTCDMPLLYYITRLLLQRGADVLQMYTDYTSLEYQAASPQGKSAWLAADALAALQAGWSQRGYSRLVLVGKSIGTLALAHLGVSEAEPPRASAGVSTVIWLTPLLHNADLVQAAIRATGPALFIAGTADHAHVPQTLQMIIEKTGASALLIEGANHSLEIPGDIDHSIEIMSQVSRAIGEFLDKIP